MAERDFDDRLAAGLASIADAGVRPIDARGLAVRLLAPNPRRPRWRLVPLGMRLIILLALLAVGLVVATLVPGRLRSTPPGPVGRVTPVGPTAVARTEPVLVRLDDGRILIAGGTVVPAPSEVFDPRTASFAPVGPAVRGTGTGVRLPNGNVLLLLWDDNSVSSSTVVTDGTTHDILATPSTIVDHLEGPAVAPLPDGRVLVAGGQRNQAQVQPFRVRQASAELFDPVTRSFAPTGSMAAPRLGHAAVPLPDGRVLVVGGDGDDTAEVFDADTGAFTSLGRMPTVSGNVLGVALPSGKVLVLQRSGTMTAPTDAQGPGHVDIFDPASASFQAMPPLDWAPDVAVPLPDGRVYLSGWSSTGTDDHIAWAAIYDPRSGGTAEALDVDPVNGSAIALDDGSVLFVGASSRSNQASRAAKVYSP